MGLFIRKEFFGGIVFNASTDRYFSLSHKQLESLLSYFDGIEAEPVHELADLILGRECSGQNGIAASVIDHSRSDGRLSYPLKAFVNITKGCNLYCKHCFNNSGGREAPFLCLPVMDRLFRFFEDVGVFKITLSGGEPLTHPDWDNILAHLTTTDLSASLLTNGTMIDDQAAAAIASCTNIGSVTISLDGPAPLSNDIVRGKGAFDRAVEGLVALRKAYNRRLSVRMTIMRSNHDLMDVTASLMRELSIEELKVNPINNYGRAKQCPELLISKEVYEESRRKLFGLLDGSGCLMQIPSYKYQDVKGGQLALCKSGEETFEIDGDGNVYPCSFTFGRMSAGNVNEEDLVTIMEKLAGHSINNDWCYACKGRGGTAEKTIGYIPKLITKAVI